MAMVWNNMESFRKHVEQMRMFRQSHPVLETVASRRPILDLLKITRPFHIADVTRETGGSTGLMSMTDWSVFFPQERLQLASSHQTGWNHQQEIYTGES